MKRAANKTLAMYIEKAKNKSKGKLYRPDDENKSMYDINFKELLKEH
jgi:hypothetical protein